MTDVAIFSDVDAADCCTAELLAAVCASDVAGFSAAESQNLAIANEVLLSTARPCFTESWGNYDEVRKLPSYQVPCLIFIFSCFRTNIFLHQWPFFV